MSCEFQLDHERKLVRSRGAGELSEAECLWHVQQIRALVADGTIDGTWRQIVDFSGVTSCALLPNSGVRRLAESNPWPAESRRIFVAPQAEVFGLSRMYELLAGADEQHVRVVRTEHEALQSLGLSSVEADGERRSSAT